MTNSIIDTNKKNTGQSSNNNPGWSSSGVPSFKSLITKHLRETKRTLLTGNKNNIINKQIEFLSNFKTFIIYKNKKNVFCPCCGWSGSGFITLSNYKSISYHSKCPNCDSRSRHRGLTKLLVKQLENTKLDLLFFAPELIILNLLKNNTPQILIKTADYYSVDVDFTNEDIQNLSFSSNSFDYILCNHVIEHVPNDDLAFKECSRILKENGKAIITIPGDYHLNQTIKYPQPDGNGHFRHYALDVIDKMKQYFSKVETVDLNKISDKTWKVRKNDFAFICYK